MMPVINGIMLAVSNSLAGSIVVKVTVAMALGLMAAWLARGHRAAVRHALLAAMFGVLLLLPIAAVLMPPLRVGVPVESRATLRPLVAGVDYASPFVTTRGPGTRVTAVKPRGSKLSLSNLLLVGWGAGVALFLLPMVFGVWKIRSLRRSGLPWQRGQSAVELLALDTGIHRRVEVLLHEVLPGPMMCGVVRPAIVLPRDAENWNSEDLDRAIVHELEHVRRGDSVSRCLTRAACAVYWFHPLVWMAWRKLVLEAERSCDDAVLRHSEATAYADQLVGLAKRLSVAQRLSVLAMANHADLATRVEAVLDGRQRRGRAGIFSVALVCGAAAALVIAVSPLTLVAAPQSRAIAPSTAAEEKMAFEVASVRRSRPLWPLGPLGPEEAAREWLPSFPLDSGDTYTQGGRFSANFPLSVYITFAYKISPTKQQYESMFALWPKWVTTEPFEIQAKAGGNPTKDQMRLMMQSLLADRFGLAVHYATHVVPVFALTLREPGKLGPNLRRHDDTLPCDDAGIGLPRIPPSGDTNDFPCGGFSMRGEGFTTRVGARNATMAALAVALPGISRPVIDQTGLSGRFDVQIEWEFESAIVAPFRAEPDLPGTLFLEALHEQLGLNLESRTAPVQILIIDHVERPVEN